MDINIILSSSLLAGLIAGLVAIRTSERKILIENVTQERAQWRETIRKLSLEVHKAGCSGNTEKLEELVLQLSLRLNPIDEEDKKNISVIHDILVSKEKTELLVEFRERVSLLLKHDWQRAKHESKSWFNKTEPNRIKYDDYRKGHSGEQPENTLRLARRFDLKSFFSCMLATGGIFFLVSILKKPFMDLVVEYNTDFKSLSATNHLGFFLLSLFVGLLWTPLYLWFKGSEKTFLEKWLKKSGYPRR